MKELQYFPFCERIISFDSEDKKHYSKLEFRPLFFIDEYSEIDAHKNYAYDVSFIATAHSDRFVIAQKYKNK